MAASSADVRSALELPSASSSHLQASSKKIAAQTTRKPEGISRELFSLIGPSATTLVAQLAQPRLKQKPNLGGNNNSKWELRSFKNGARSDSLELQHWVKASDASTEDAYQFVKYNVQRPTFAYSLDEYTQLLEGSSITSVDTRPAYSSPTDKDWTKEETDYLMNIVHEYETRWYVIHDRYDYPAGSARSMEDLKDRYCSVCRKLIRNQPWASDDASKNTLLASFSFEKDREVLRKKYIASLEDRTKEQIAEEEALYIEVKRLEQNERRFKRDRDNLLRTLAGIESGLPDIVEDEVQLAQLHADMKFSSHNKRKGGMNLDIDIPSTPLASSSRRPTIPKNSAYDAQHCITRQDLSSSSANVTKAAHQPAFLRSFRMPYPKSNIAPKVTQILTELGVSHTRLVMPTLANITALENLMDAASTLVETKKVVDKVDYDIQVMKSRLGMQESAPTKTEDMDDATMDVDDADGEIDAEGEDGRAQSVVSTRSARSRKQRRSMSVSSVDTVSTRAGTKRQRR
ncbi:unnamed protein product [Mycena citricolor]|uniref:SWR1-complex protein 4 n=1 Tax=Mycena citricolor TaxID=2018698 RepID=A0AAD2JWY1_9AGAR|nr:unnamed protein product [Mycena citricolor]